MNIGYSDWQSFLGKSWAGSFPLPHGKGSCLQKQGYIHTFRWHNQPQTSNQTPIINLNILQTNHQLMENTNSLSSHNSFHLLRKSKSINWPLLGIETSSIDHWLHSVRVTIHSQGKYRNGKLTYKTLRNLNPVSLWPHFLLVSPLLLCSHQAYLLAYLLTHQAHFRLRHLHLFSLLRMPFSGIFMASPSPSNLAQIPP